MNLLKNKIAQGMVVEYALTFALVAAFVTGMLVYVRRTLQARIHGAEKYVMSDVEKVYYDPKANLAGEFYQQYEPYYVSSQARRTAVSDVTEKTLPAGSMGIYDKQVNEITVTKSSSFQAPPMNAD
jgi:hypothetical protein